MSEKKQRYICLVCGAILDTPDFCEYCGAGKEDIVPYFEDESEE